MSYLKSPLVVYRRDHVLFTLPLVVIGRIMSYLKSSLVIYRRDHISFKV